MNGDAPAGNRRSRTVWFALAIFLLALLVRLPHLRDGLWYDEMYTLLHYVLQAWSRVLAAAPGQYVPNNHVLHTILAKLVYTLGKHEETAGLGPNEPLLRVPALLAGCLLPIALAWPLRRRAPWAALLVAVVAAVHPWLIAFSDEARGYSLMLLLGVIATNLLPDGTRRWPIRYALALAGAIYTIPIALMLVPAHLIALVAQRQSRAVSARTALFSERQKTGPRRPGSPVENALVAWICGIALALLVSTLLYLPMLRGMLTYYRQPYETTITYREFLDELPRFALGGERLPSAAIYWALPMLSVMIGSAIGWPRAALRPLLVTFGVATLLGISLPILAPAATEVRFVPWAGLWFIIAIASLLLAPPQRWARGVAIAGVALLLAWMVVRDAKQLPDQPIREAIVAADQVAPPGVRIVLTYIGAREAAYLYGPRATRHAIDAAHDMPRLLEAEQRAVLETGQRPWLVVFYEELARQRDAGPEDSRGLWTHLIKQYRLVARLPGRISPVLVCAPATTQPSGPDLALSPGRSTRP
jgi:hypothetical protein